MMAYPSLEWLDCNIPDQRPDDCRRVIVWHRARPWCRFYRPVIGWWNGGEWRTDYDGANWQAGIIYQPQFWKDIIGPNNERP